MFVLIEWDPDDEPQHIEPSRYLSFNKKMAEGIDIFGSLWCVDGMNFNIMLCFILLFSVERNNCIFLILKFVTLIKILFQKSSRHF